MSNGVIGSFSMLNDYNLNTVFDDVSMREGFRNNALPRSPGEKLQLVAILLLHVKRLSLQERNMLFVDRPVK